MFTGIFKKVAFSAICVCICLGLTFASAEPLPANIVDNPAESEVEELGEVTVEDVCEEAEGLARNPSCHTRCVRNQEACRSSCHGQGSTAGNRDFDVRGCKNRCADNYRSCINRC